MGSSALRICTWRKYAVVLVQASFLHLARNKRKPNSSAPRYLAEPLPLRANERKRTVERKSESHTFRPIHIPPALLSPQYLPAAPLHRSPEVKVPALEIPAVEHHLVGAGAAFEAVGVGQGVVLGRQVVRGQGGDGEHVAAGGAD